MEFRVGEILSGDAAGNPDAAKPEALDRMLDLFGGKLRELQCGRRESDKAVGMRGAEFGQLLVLDADPTVDVANLRKISRLMLAGALIDRAALLQR